MTDWLLSQNTLMQTRQQAVGMWQVLLEEGVLVHGECVCVSVCVCVWGGGRMEYLEWERVTGAEDDGLLLSYNTLLQTRQQAVGMWQVLL